MSPTLKNPSENPKFVLKNHWNFNYKKYKKANETGYLKFSYTNKKLDISFTLKMYRL